MALLSLQSALNNSVSALRTTQSQLSLLSHNIANANTEGYSKQIGNQEAVYYDGYGYGVKMGAISRRVDEILIRSVQRQEAVVGENYSVNQYMESIQLLLGSPGEGNDLTAYIDNFFSTMQNLSDSPDKMSMREAAVGSAVVLADQISVLAAELQNLRFEADREILDSVSFLNDQISRLDELNNAIANATALESEAPDLLDERDSILKEMAKIVNISTYEDVQGRVSVMTGNGMSLLENNKSIVSYRATQSVSQIIGDNGFAPIIVTATDDDGRPGNSFQYLVQEDGTTNLKAGKLKGLLQIRDTLIPNLLGELDELSATLRDEVNAIHNDGAGFPPKNTLTGTTETTWDTVHDWSGSFRVGALQADGTTIDTAYDSEDYTGVRPLTIDLGSLDVGNGAGRWSTRDIVDEINAHFEAPQKKISINGLNDIRLVSLVENTPAGAGFSFDFDFENILADDVTVDVTNITIAGGALTSALPGVTTVSAGEKSRTGAAYSFDANLAGVATIAVDIDVLNVTTGLTESATIEFTVDTSVTDIKNDRYIGTVTAGTAVEELPNFSTRIATARVADSTGNTATSIESGFLEIYANNTSNVIVIDQLDSVDLGQQSIEPLVPATNRGISHYFGLNNFFVEDDDTVEGTALNLQVRQDIIDNPSFISTGEMVISYPPADAATKPLYTYELGSGNNAVIQRIVELANTQVRFDAAGTLPSISREFSIYSATILGSISSQAITIEQTYIQSQRLQEGYVERASAASGVDVDEELANAIRFQNAYQASARVITVANEMFDALLNAV